MSTIGYLDAWEWHIRKDYEPAIGVFTDKVLRFCHCIHREALDIRIALIVCIEENGCPNFIRLPLLYPHNIVRIVVVGVEIRNIEVVVIKDNEDAVFIKELPKEASVFLIVDALHIGIKPHFTSTER